MRVQGFVANTALKGEVGASQMITRPATITSGAHVFGPMPTRRDNIYHKAGIFLGCIDKTQCMYTNT